MSTSNDRRINVFIVMVSIAVPLLVTFLFYSPVFNIGIDLSMLPKVHATINGTVALLLIVGMVMIRLGKMAAHRACMMTAFSLSALFLISYVIYHGSVESTHYGGEGIMKTIYFVVLISHIFLAALILPLVLITFSRALQKRFDKHKRIARWTFPIWLYVSISGVLVYLMIAPYYLTLP